MAKIKCAECRFTKQDKVASEYTKKKCAGCPVDGYCTCKKKSCVCGEGCEFKYTERICPKQILKWEAIQCANADGPYHRSLLNVTINGEKQKEITWSGCEYGERRDGA